MGFLIHLALLVAYATAKPAFDIAALARLAYPHLAAEAEQFGDFVNKYGKEYATKEEALERFSVFVNNLADIKRFNEEAKGVTTYGITSFADWTWDEFRKTLLHAKVPALNTSEIPMIDIKPQSKGLPDSWDWRVSNIVTGIKNQGSCGSCWSFATVAVFESMHAKANRGLWSFSEQQLIDCIEGGCNGGVVLNAFGYAKDHGLPVESDYPYRGSRGQCQNAKVAERFNQIYQLPGDEEKMAWSVHDGGPFAITFRVGNSFMHYTGGVATSTDCNDQESWHAVSVIGFGNGYWLVKNSWGTGWGEGGFGRIHRGSGWCSITLQPVAGGIW